MSSLLTDIETNGDSIKLWLTENCIFEDGAFESTASLYDNYRYWCDENGVGFAGRPKMRNVIMTYRPEATADRKRVGDSETGEIKLIWGLSSVRLRTLEDDFPDDYPDPTNPADPTSEDPVDPVYKRTGSRQKPDNQASRSGDPVDSQKLPTIEEMEAEPSDSVVESFSQNDRITGSGGVETSPKCDRHTASPSDPVFDPFVARTMQQSRLSLNESSGGMWEKLRFHPDLMSTPRKR